MALTPRSTRAERTAAGRALRNKVARSAHAGWRASATRADPIDLLISSSRDRLPDLVPLRYGRMSDNPLAFLRGSAIVMAADLARTPASGIRVQACGDCHLMNFGAFATPERNVVFGINDFDETLPAPWEWDIKRLTASLAAATRLNGFSRADARDVATRCAKSYREHMTRFARLTVLARWYEPLDVHDMLALVSRRWKQKIQKEIAQESARDVMQDDFPKLVSVRKGVCRIKDNPPLIFHQTQRSARAFNRDVAATFARYCRTLADDRRALLERFEIKDVALKVVGVGSVGLRCAITLLMAGADDALFLQIKQAHPSVLARYAGASHYGHDGQRVIAGQRLLQPASDLFLGWTTYRGLEFYVRQLRDIRIKPSIEELNARELAVYGECCGWALARAHAKAGDAAMISGYLGDSPKFDRAVAKFAVDYTDQNERDHEALVKAIRSGRVQAVKD